MKCPICCGLGNLPDPNNKIVAEKQIKELAVKTLHNNYFSNRQILKILGWKSMSKVQKILKGVEIMQDNSTRCKHPEDAVKYNSGNKVTQCHKCGKVIKN